MALLPQDIEKIERIATLLKQSQSVLFITGAGISADSGLPTYRGIGGLYDSRDTQEGIPIETALSGAVMAERPEITWKYLARIEQACHAARFNRAHQVIAEMDNHFERVWVLTQNIDGFHHAAGSTNVIDIHGDVHNLTCTRCRYHTTVTDYSRLDVPPRCPDCNAIVRPDVVLFGEMLDTGKCQILADELARGFDIVFTVGTTSVFPYIARPVFDAKQRGAHTVEINPGQTQVSHLVDIILRTTAAETLDAIWRHYETAAG